MESAYSKRMILQDIVITYIRNTPSDNGRVILNEYVSMLNQIR